MDDGKGNKTETEATVMLAFKTNAAGTLEASELIIHSSEPSKSRSRSRSLSRSISSVRSIPKSTVTEVGSPRTYTSQAEVGVSWVCQHCSVRQSSKSALKRHKRRCHLRQDRDNRCRTCDQSLPRYFCLICTRRLRNASEFQEHMDGHRRPAPRARYQAKLPQWGTQNDRDGPDRWRSRSCEVREKFRRYRQRSRSR